MLHEILINAGPESAKVDMGQEWEGEWLNHWGERLKSETDNGQFDGKCLKIIFHLDIAFR